MNVSRLGARGEDHVSCGVELTRVGRCLITTGKDCGGKNVTAGIEHAFPLPLGERVRASLYIWISANALRSGASEIWMGPWKGISMSSTR